MQIGPGQGVAQLDIEQAAVRVEHGQVIGVAVVVAEPGDFGILAQAVHLALLGGQLPVGLLAGHKRVVDLAEAVLHRPLVGGEHLRLHGLGLAHVARDPAGGEDGQAHRHGVLPDLRRPGEQVIEVTAGRTEGPGQTDARKISRPSGADAGIGRDQVLLGLADVGPSLEQGRGQAGGRCRHLEFVDGQAARNRPGIAAQQDAQAVFLLRHRLFQGRDGSQGLLVLGAVLAEFQVGDEAAAKPFFEQVVGLLTGARRLPGDFQLPVQGAQVDIGGGNVAHQGEHHPAAAFLAGQQLGLGRLGQAPDAAPQVDLPAGADRRGKAVGGGPVAWSHRVVARLGDPLPGVLGTAPHLGEEFGAGGAVASGILFHPGRGDAQVPVFLKGRGNQLVEHRVAELLPPGGVGQFSPILFGQAPAGRGVELRSTVVRPDGAAREGEHQHTERENPLHGLTCLLRDRTWSGHPLAARSFSRRSIFRPRNR